MLSIYPVLPATQGPGVVAWLVEGLVCKPEAYDSTILDEVDGFSVDLILLAELRP
jgi:hypothetical protein